MYPDKDANVLKDRHRHLYFLYTHEYICNIHTITERFYCLSSEKLFRRFWDEIDEYFKLSECVIVFFIEKTFLSLYLETFCFMRSNKNSSLIAKQKKYFLRCFFLYEALSQSNRKNDLFYQITYLWRCPLWSLYSNSKRQHSLYDVQP